MNIPSIAALMFMAINKTAANRQAHNRFHYIHDFMVKKTILINNVISQYPYPRRRKQRARDLIAKFQVPS